MNKFTLSGMVSLVLFLMLPALHAQASWSRQEVMTLVVEEAQRQGFSPALALAVAKVESDFNPLAESHVGARGVMQIMPKTAEEDLDISAARLYNPRINIRGGVRFLKQLMRSYGGRTDIALSHYNGGSRVRQADGSLRVLSYTKAYVDKVMSNARTFRFHPIVIASGNAKSYSLNNNALALDDFSYGNPLTKPIIRPLANYRGRNDDVAKVSSYKRQNLVEKLKTLVHYNQQRTLAPKSKRPTANNRSYRKALVAQWESF